MDMVVNRLVHPVQPRDALAQRELLRKIQDEFGFAARLHREPGQRGGTQVAIVVGAGLGLTDLSELAAPEPLHHMLRALAALVPGQAVLARLPRYPTLLIPELERPELSFELLELEDETVLLWVERG